MDELYEEVGSFGRFQKLVLLITGLLTALTAIPVYLTIFTLAEPKLNCLNINATNYTESFGIDEYCKIQPNAIYFNFSYDESNYVECKYDTTYYGQTVVTEWNLICNQKYKASLAQMLYMVGSAFTVIGGPIGDRYGRKRSILVSVLFLSLSLIVTQFLQLSIISSPTRLFKFWIYCLSQLFVGFFASLTYFLTFVIAMEFTATKHHSLFGILLVYFFVFGEFCVLFMSYFFRDWQTLQWITGCSSVIVTIATFMFLPESPSWLISKRKYNEAKNVLVKIAKLNNNSYIDIENNFNKKMCLLLESKSKVNVDDNMEDISFEIRYKKRDGIIKTLFWPFQNIVKTTILGYTMIVGSLIYYGISFGLTKMEFTDPYLLFLFSSLAEFIGFSITYINQSIGRKNTNILFLVTTTISCSIVGLLTSTPLFRSDSLLKNTIITLVFVSLGKCMVSAAYNNLWIYSSELYPTSCRASAILFLSSLSRIGSFLSPVIILLGSTYWKPLPYIVYSLVGSLSIILGFILPDVYHK